MQKIMCLDEDCTRRASSASILAIKIKQLTEDEQAQPKHYMEDEQAQTSMYGGLHLTRTGIDVASNRYILQSRFELKRALTLYAEVIKFTCINDKATGD
jgi:hypothetical protein